MNATAEARLLYQNWLWSNHPQIYDRTIRPVLDAAMKTRGNQPLGDWIDDLLASTSYIPTLNVDSGSSSSTSSSSGNSIWDNIFSSVTSLGSQYVATSAAQQLINLNTQRARSGLPPLDQNGNIITNAQMAAQSGNYLALQQWLASQGQGAVPTWMWIGGAALLAITVFGLARN